MTDFCFNVVLKRAQNVEMNSFIFCLFASIVGRRIHPFSDNFGINA